MNKKLHEDLKTIAKGEFTNEESIIKKGLKIFLMYKLRVDYQIFLEEHTLEECIQEAMKDLGMSEEEVIFASLDTYKAIVLGMSINERKVDYDYYYKFIPNTLTVYKVENELSWGEVWQEEKAKLIAEQEAIIDNAIANATKMLEAKTIEINEADKVVADISKQLSKINLELTTLKAKSLVTMTPSQRAKNKQQITDLQAKSTILLKDLQEAKEVLVQLKNERFYINEDIEAITKLLEETSYEGFYSIDKIKNCYR